MFHELNLRIDKWMISCADALQWLFKLNIHFARVGPKYWSSSCMDNEDWGHSGWGIPSVHEYQAIIMPGFIIDFMPLQSIELIAHND